MKLSCEEKNWLARKREFLVPLPSTKNPLLTSSSKTIIIFPSTSSYYHLLIQIPNQPPTTADSIHQGLIERGDREEIYHQPPTMAVPVHQGLIERADKGEIYYPPADEEDNTDESNIISILNAILSGTARLNVLLPSATILAFSIFAPLLTNDGNCDPLNRWLMGGFLAVSAVSCVFLSLTDSFKTATGRLYYGVATFEGIWTFNGGKKQPRVPSDYRLRWDDLFHASLSLIAFLTFAALHLDVVACYYPALPRKVTNTVPLVVGFVISLLFVMFPSRRRGIGYPFLLQKDAIYCRN